MSSSLPAAALPASRVPDSTAIPGGLAQLTGVGLTLSSPAGPVNILHDLSFTLTAGEIVAVVGPSGAGKTSLLMLMSGLERPSCGQVVVAGQNLATLDESALARFRRRHVGIVFQNFHLIPTLTARENVALPLSIAGHAAAGDVAQAELEAVGLAARAGHYPAQLSGGEQQRVALARALVAAPPLLLADEPTGNLDGETGQRIADLLFDQALRKGATLVLVTHDAALAARCSRRLPLRNGTLVCE